jgi:hypothetical protein
MTPVLVPKNLRSAVSEQFAKGVRTIIVKKSAEDFENNP